jgi:CRISPR-associated protein Csd1
VNCAFGTEREEKGKTSFKTDDRILREQIERLVSCKVDKCPMPFDVEQALVNKVKFSANYEDSDCEKVLHTACAVIRKYHYDRNGVEISMALEKNKEDISYQYGRLLAVFEKAERDTYDTGEGREPNAIRMQAVFCQRPQYASRVIWEQLKKAYYPKLRPGTRAYYDKLIGEIMEEISKFPEEKYNRPLGDQYIIGYYLQRNELYTKSRKDENDNIENREEN